MANDDYSKLRAVFSSQLKDASDDVLRVLRDPIVLWLDMNWEGMHINGQSLEKIAQLIERKKILAFFDPNNVKLPADVEAQYFEAFDIMLIRRPASGVLGRSAILHEAIHAVNDSQGKDIKNVINEKFAFVFQAMYLRASGMASDMNNLDIKDKALLGAAVNIADALVDHRRPQDRDVVALVAAMRRYPYYSSNEDQSRINGVRQ